MSAIIFEVPGPLFGYRRVMDRGGYSTYAKFKKRVLLIAQAKGWPGLVKTSSEWPCHFSVHVAWRLKPRIDWPNVYKGIEDALFEQDRYVLPGDRNNVIWNTKEAEHAIVQINF